MNVENTRLSLPNSTLPDGTMPKLSSDDDNIRQLLKDEEILVHRLTDTAKAALARAMECGRYILFVGRFEHRDEGGLQWFYQQNDFLDDDAERAPMQLMKMYQNAKERNNAGPDVVQPD